MKGVVNIHRNDPSNIGDWFCTPRFYFNDLKEIDKLDIWKTNFSDPKNNLKNKKVIFGGGGLIGNVDFEKNLHTIIASEPELFICWGAGHNRHDGDRIDYSNYLSAFTLKGVRDYNIPGTEWVPCVSCMHSAFTKEYPIKNRIVVYEHKDHIIDTVSFPKLNNKHNKIDDVIAFLGSSEIVVTSTYHGAYWATLLNKKVIVVNPFSTKFKGLKHQPVFADLNTFESQIENCKNYPDALDECREANLNFSKKVLQLIC